MMFFRISRAPEDTKLDLFTKLLDLEEDLPKNATDAVEVYLNPGNTLPLVELLPDYWINQNQAADAMDIEDETQDMIAVESEDGDRPQHEDMIDPSDN